MKTIKNKLRERADYYNHNGYSTTQFMRSLAYDAWVYFGLDIDSVDDFYRKSTNPYMERVLNWLGYQHTEFGIMRKY